MVDFDKSAARFPRLWLLQILVAFCAPAMTMASDREVPIDLKDLGQPFGGWGTSLAWWAHGVGDWPAQTVDQIVHLITDSKDGLGLTVFRYNIGGGDQPGHHHLRRWADVPGFKPAADAPYDWGADAAQRLVLLKLVKASADRPVVEGFSNSAPWWMTVSKCVAGATDGGSNLQPDSEGAFSSYLADVTEFYKEKFGLVFHSLEPFNEPDVRWWKAGKDQEGMNVPRDQQARVIRMVRAALDQRGLRTTMVSATDANSIDDCLTSWNSFDAATRAAIGQVNTHSYYGTKRAELSEAIQGRPLWISESGPLNVGGSEFEQIIKMAHRIVLDINLARPEVWCMWQAVSGGPWGCLHEDVNHQTFRIGRAFQMYAAFTRHVRPGDRFVKLTDDRVLASVSTARKEVTIVLVNPDNAPCSFHLTMRDSPFPLTATAAGDCVDVRGENPLAPLPLHQGALEVISPAESVTSLTISDSHL